MNKFIKIFLLSFIFSGSIYAGLSAGFDYKLDQEFDLQGFVVKFVFFGLFMAALNVFNAKRREKKRSGQPS